MRFDYIEQGNCLDKMRELPDGCIDMIMTSPPYDNLRDYNGYSFDFENIAREMFRIMKDGSVAVWIVSDATIDGSETGTSFKQALFFKEIGFNLHDTMIWEKPCFTATGTLSVRYASVFEYMFVLSKGKPKTFNPLKDRKNIYAGAKSTGSIRQKDGTMKPRSTEGKIYGEYGQRYNVWHMNPVKPQVTQKYQHPAQFPVEMARDHILSWTNKGDIVLDCFMGSGTTAIACLKTERHYIGFDISEEYVEMAEGRIKDEIESNPLFYGGIT